MRLSVAESPFQAMPRSFSRSEFLRLAGSSGRSSWQNSWKGLVNAAFLDLLAGDAEASPVDAGRLEDSTDVRGAAEGRQQHDRIIRCGASGLPCEWQ